MEILIYDEKKELKKYSKLFISMRNFSNIYENSFLNMKRKYSFFISDNYVDKKQVMINIIENQTKISFEINKANILNRDMKSLQILSF